jgi:outer membrane protein assembly factor BamB
VWGDLIFVLTATETDREAKPEELPKPDPKFRTMTRPPTRVFKFEVHAFDRGTGKRKWTALAAEVVPHEGTHATHNYAGGSRRPTAAALRLLRLLRRLRVRPRRQAALEARPRSDAHAPRLGRGGHTRRGRRHARPEPGPGGGVELVALDAATGETKWEADRDEKSSWNTPLVVEHGKRTQVIVNGTTRARSYDLADGKVIWRSAA